MPRDNTILGAWDKQTTCLGHQVLFVVAWLVDGFSGILIGLFSPPIHFPFLAHIPNVNQKHAVVALRYIMCYIKAINRVD